MSQEPFKKLGEIKMPEVSGAQLARLDTSIPYIILLPQNTPDRVCQELVAFFGRSNVMATFLLGDPKNFRLFASTPWSVTPQKIVADIHPLTLPETELARVFKQNFISSLHEDAEAVQDLYGYLVANGLDTRAVVTLEAMVRCGILKFQVLAHMFPEASTAKPAKQLEEKVNEAILAIVTEFTADAYKDSEKHKVDAANIATLVDKFGTNSKVETLILSLQNAGQLTSVILSILRADYPEKIATKVARKAAPVVKKRAPVKSKK